MTDKKNPPKDGVTLAALGAGLLVAVCCAGPALIAAGALGAVGGAVHSFWLLALGAVAALVAIYTVRRRHAPHLAKPDDCCLPVAKEDEHSR